MIERYSIKFLEYTCNAFCPCYYEVISQAYSVCQMHTITSAKTWWFCHVCWSDIIFRISMLLQIWLSISSVVQYLLKFPKITAVGPCLYENPKHFLSFFPPFCMSAFVSFCFSLSAYLACMHASVLVPVSTEKISEYRNKIIIVHILAINSNAHYSDTEAHPSELMSFVTFIQNNPNISPQTFSFSVVKSSF